MDILEQGQLPEDKEYTTTCTYCQTKFKFQAKEAISKTSYRNEDYFSVICPFDRCSRQMYVEI